MLRSCSSILLTLSLLLLADAASAGCCNLVKVDEEVPTVILRICEPGIGSSCATVLAERPISVGEIENVCTVSDTIVYLEDLGAGFGAPVEAVCSGVDIEI